MIPGMARRLLNLEARLGPGGRASSPSMVTLLVFADDALVDARAFAEALRKHFRDARPDLFVEVVEFPIPRPAGLKPAWAPPRLYFDYEPTAHELADLRPDLRPPPPGIRRQDWLPPDPPPRGIPGPVDTPLESRPPPTGDTDFKECTP